MATLPTASNIIGAVQPQSAPNVRVPQDAFPNYDVAGDTRGKVGRAFAGSIIRENIETEAQDLANQLNTFGRNLESGNATGDDYDAEGNLAPDRADFEPGYLNQYNRKAMDTRSDYEKRFAEKRKELDRTATSDAVRRMFRRQPMPERRLSSIRLARISTRSARGIERPSSIRPLMKRARARLPTPTTQATSKMFTMRPSNINDLSART